MLKHVVQCSAGYGRATRIQSRVVQLHPNLVAAFLYRGPEMHYCATQNCSGPPRTFASCPKLQHKFPEAGLMLCPLPKTLRAYSTFNIPPLLSHSTNVH